MVVPTATLQKRDHTRQLPLSQSPALKVEALTEREIIEAALAETRGRVSGPSGAAAKLRIPPSTLETRIKALKIDKQQFKYG
jgi:DNA-binding NtrC family response regulator